MISETLTLRFDGGSRGNPGPAGIGIVILAADGTPLLTVGRYIGNATNNVAEYRALVAVLEEAQKLGATRIIVRGDSELVVKQMLGQYRVRHPDLIPLHAQAKKLMSAFAVASIEHDLRSANDLPDKLYNAAMERRGEVTDIDGDSGPARVATPLDVGTRFTCPACGMGVEVRVASSWSADRLTRPLMCACGNAFRAR